ncbi:MAG: hypothetical protein DMG15_22390 [Acidobacteria bacterium]|nr:MAG: hypothetical protein DMG16_22660 [Acidobacteriota bacterium]PYS09939.1 MAG: hypothetical protein DMG15_22390 [Acidobacteriota bacterium]
MIYSDACLFCLENVQQQLGHASIKMTVDTYTHLIPGAGRQALAALPGIASPIVTETATAVAGD